MARFTRLRQGSSQTDEWSEVQAEIGCSSAESAELSYSFINNSIHRAGEIQTADDVVHGEFQISNWVLAEHVLREPAGFAAE